MILITWCSLLFTSCSSMLSEKKVSSRDLAVEVPIKSKELSTKTMSVGSLLDYCSGRKEVSEFTESVFDLEGDDLREYCSKCKKVYKGVLISRISFLRFKNRNFGLYKEGKIHWHP